jgi:hypothetical protein
MAKNKITAKKLEDIGSFLDLENINFLTGYVGNENYVISEHRGNYSISWTLKSIRGFFGPKNKCQQREAFFKLK